MGQCGCRRCYSLIYAESICSLPLVRNLHWLVRRRGYIGLILNSPIFISPG
jgi:hypothetical protein